MRRLTEPVDRFVDRWTPKRVRQYPLETLLAFWCPVSAASAAFGSPPAALRAMPHEIVIWWAVTSGVAGVMIAAGLIFRLYGTLMARGMYTLGGLVLAFGIAALANAHNTTNSIIGPTFLMVVAIFFWIRGWELRKEEEALARILRLNGNDRG